MKIDLNKLAQRRTVKLHIRDSLIEELRDYVIDNLTKIEQTTTGLYTISDVIEYINGCQYELLQSYIKDANTIGWDVLLNIICDSLNHAHDIHIGKTEGV